MTVPSEVLKVWLGRWRELRGAVLPGGGKGGDKQVYSTLSDLLPDLEGAIGAERSL